MATGGGDLLATLSEDILTCEICQEEFDLTTRPPRVLPCYHSFCGVCVETLGKEGSVKCPKCRQVAAITDKGFPMDTTRVALLDWRQSVHSQEGVACEGCPVGAKATSKCQDCDEYFCNECTTFHRRFKMSRGHSMVSLSEAAKSPDKLVQPLSEKCESHAEEKLKLFCLTCGKAVCSICALTLHLEGHKFVELKSVLENKKKEMLSVCEQLDEAQESFQKKAEECEASLEALECNRRETERQVKDAFSCVISTALERQAEVLEELSAKVKCERLLLEEQLANFRSLQAATQSAADYGRRLVSVSVASQVLNEKEDLERTAAELKEKLTTAVAAAPTYKVETDKVEELKTLLKSLGAVESASPAAAADDDDDASAAAADAAAAADDDADDDANAAASSGAGGLPIVFPDIRLDDSRCHGDCSVSAGGCSLINQPHSPCLSLSQERFRFLGTCGREALAEEICYWQIRFRASPDPQMAEGWWWLCECGVSSMQDLEAAGQWIDGEDRSALTVALVPSGGSVEAWVYHCGELLTSTELSPFSPHSPVEQTLGFLLDSQRKRLVVVDVDGRQVLCEREGVTSQPLWPCVSVANPASETDASVCVSVESGQQVTLTPDVVSLLRSLLK